MELEPIPVGDPAVPGQMYTTQELEWQAPHDLEELKRSVSQFFDSHPTLMMYNPPFKIHANIGRGGDIWPSVEVRSYNRDWLRMLVAYWMREGSLTPTLDLINAQVVEYVSKEET